jgi:hypothetical protein
MSKQQTFSKFVDWVKSYEPLKCSTVIGEKWNEIGRSMTDQKFSVRSSLFQSLRSILHSRQLFDYDLWIKVCRGGLHPVHVPHEHRVLELDVGLVLVLELLRVEGADARADLELKGSSKLNGVRFTK